MFRIELAVLTHLTSKSKKTMFAMLMNIAKESQGVFFDVCTIY